MKVGHSSKLGLPKHTILFQGYVFQNKLGGLDEVAVVDGIVNLNVIKLKLSKIKSLSVNK